MEPSLLGFDTWFAEQYQKTSKQDFHPARICAVDKDNFLIISEHGEMQAQVTGRLRFETESNIDYPVVGDWVLVGYYNDCTLAIIHEILPRKTLLKRKAAGKKIDFQLIGANIDTACIMQSLDADFNISRLERYMVAILEAGITPAILLSKSDLISSDQCGQKIVEVKKRYPGCKIIAFSNLSLDGMNDLSNIFLPAKTYCIIGSSGVGKTTLLNKLLGTETFSTKGIRKHEHGGKHTTTRRQLIPLHNGALYIDTPGMRELGLISADSGIQKAFPDIELLAEKCRFPDCTHAHEPGCSIQEALKSGDLPLKRFNSYVKLRKESEYHKRSYVEKRKKDKKFGKFIKSVMKEKKKKWLT
ncbi:MAG: ribosome small subunit-dependent GTPase A [bacterium]